MTFDKSAARARDRSHIKAVVADLFCRRTCQVRIHYPPLLIAASIASSARSKIVEKAHKRFGIGGAGGWLAVLGLLTHAAIFRKRSLATVVRYC
jgi:hypothetical protein